MEYLGRSLVKRQYQANREYRGPGGATRTVAALELFNTPFEPTLAANEVLTEIEVPAFTPDHRAEYAKVAHPASGFAVVCGAVVVTVDGDQCTSANIAVGGLVPAPCKSIFGGTGVVRPDP